MGAVLTVRVGIKSPGSDPVRHRIRILNENTRDVDTFSLGRLT